MTAVEQGTIKFFNADRGFGFIKPTTGNDIFAHANEVLGDWLPAKDDRVEFTRGTGRDGRPAAKRIKIIVSAK